MNYIFVFIRIHLYCNKYYLKNQEYLYNYYALVTHRYDKKRKKGPISQRRALIASVCVLYFVKTRLADLLTLEFDHVGFISAEITAGMIFSEDDLVALDVYFYGI